MEMFEPAGMGIVVFSPAAFVMVIVVSSATLLGILCTGGKSRSVSFRTLHICVLVSLQTLLAEINTDARL